MSPFRLKVKERVTGVIEGGIMKPVQSRYAETGSLYYVLKPKFEGKVKVMKPVPEVGEAKVKRVLLLLR